VELSGTAATPLLPNALSSAATVLLVVVPVLFDALLPGVVLVVPLLHAARVSASALAARVARTVLADFATFNPPVTFHY
jgi:hypothetical protein